MEATSYGFPQDLGQGVPYVGHRNLGAELVRMQQAGRGVINSERNRWQVNRYMYRGQQWLRVVGNTVRSLAPTDRLPPGRRRYTVNRARQFLDGRVAMLASSRPASEVEAAGQTQAQVDGARLADKFVDVHWAPDYWDLDMHFRSIERAGEIDGITFGCVMFDPTRGKKITVAWGVDGKPITDPELLAAVKAQDPMGEVLWKPVQVNVGEIVFRVVRPGALSIDPLMQDDWSKCRYVIESVIEARSEVEKRIGRSLDELMKDSHLVMTGTKMGGSEPTAASYAIAVDDIDSQERALSGEDVVVVHRLFHKPCGYFPKGAHIWWVDQAPGIPILQEEWDDELPYFPFMPKPDGNHILRSRGTMDELAPIQVMFNKTLSQLGEWLDKVANPPLVVANGSLKTKDIYSNKGVILVHGGMQEPRFMVTPSEPTAVLNNFLEWLTDQMANVSSQHDASRGQAPGKAEWAAASLQQLIQQNEQTMSGTAAELVRYMDWSVSRALYLVGRHYTIARMINTPGVDSVEQFNAFQGSMLQGACNFRVKGSLLPNSRAAQTQLLLQLAQYSQMDLRPYLPALLEGKIDEVISKERKQAEKQRRENRKILGMIKQPGAMEAWQRFEMYQQEYAGALQELRQAPPDAGPPGAGPPAEPAEGQPPTGQESGAPMQVAGMPAPPGPSEDPMGYLAARGAPPPTLDMVGIQALPVNEFDNHAIHVMEIDDLCVSDGYDDFHPMTKMLLKQHRDMHLMEINKQAQAIALQGGGEPSMDDTAGANEPPDDKGKEPSEQAAE